MKIKDIKDIIGDLDDDTEVAHVGSNSHGLNLSILIDGDLVNLYTSREEMEGEK